MIRIVLLNFFLSIMAFSPFASAIALDGISWKVNRIFTEGQNTAGIYIPNPSICTWGIAYIDLARTAGRAQFAQLLTAKVLGHSIVRFDYSKNASGLCQVEGIHTQ